MTKINVNGIQRDMTVEEQTTYDARQQRWIDQGSARKLSIIKKERLKRFQETDYLALGDVSMPENIKTWRQLLRDIPQTNTTEEEYDLILSKDEDGNLTNAIWSKP